MNAYEIAIQGEATVHGEKGGQIKGSKLKQFDGISDDSEFSEYFHKAMPKEMLAGEQQQSLIDAGVTGGYMRFEYDAVSKKLFTITTYDAPRKLTAHEEEVLIEYTQGQWSDGVGEGFEQHEERGAYISAWHSGQVATLSYKYVGTVPELD